MADEQIVAWPSRQLMWDISEAEKPLPEGCAVYIREDVALASRDAVIEECAKVADAHKGAAAKIRQSRGKTLARIPEEAWMEITAEERGEDIAAEVIARDIRSLKSKGGGNDAD